MKKANTPPKKVADTDTTGRAERYQVSRTLPDLREGTPQGKVGRQASPASAPVAETKNKRHVPWKKIIKRTLLAVLILGLLIGGWLGFKAYQNSRKLGTSIWSVFDNAKLRGEDRDQINILIAGVSTDDPGHQGADLTDSIMLVSIHPKAKTATLLSIPRDLYVNIPGYGYAKINAAYKYGNAGNFSEAGYPKGGAGLLEKVVSQKLNVPIDYYAIINYSAFKDSVNAVGGVTINLQGSSPYGVYDPYTNLKLPNGTVNLDGQTALNLARSRGDGPGSYGIVSDFDRTQHQRDIMIALKDKASSAGVLSNPVKVSNLFDAAGNNVKTDLSLGNVRRLITLTKPIPSSSISSAGLDKINNVILLRSYTTSDGQSALIPVAGLNTYGPIQAAVAALLTPPAPAPKTTN